MVGWEGGRFLVFLKGRGHSVSPRFCFCVSDVNQGNQEVGWVQHFLAWRQGWKESPENFD